MPFPTRRLHGPSAGESITDVRCRIAAQVGYAARRLWRRADLTAADNVILDLLTEALGHLGQKVKVQGFACGTILFNLSQIKRAIGQSLFPASAMDKHDFRRKTLSR